MYALATLSHSKLLLAAALGTTRNWAVSRSCIPTAKIWIRPERVKLLNRLYNQCQVVKEAVYSYTQWLSLLCFKVPETCREDAYSTVKSWLLQFSPFITLCSGSIEMDCVINELCVIYALCTRAAADRYYNRKIIINCVIKGQFYKGIIGRWPLQRNYRKMTISWSSSYNSFVKFHAKRYWEPQHDCVVSKAML